MMRLKFLKPALIGALTVGSASAGFAGTTPVKTAMVSIPAGELIRADKKIVRVAAFSILSTEVTWSQFKTVRDWAEKHEYTFEEGIGQCDLPAQNITWYDAVKWCNAMSEMAGKTPAYYTDDARKQLYRQGRADLRAANVNWDANGFRLPTEAEWEYAFRAGTTTPFYWGSGAREDERNHQYAAFHFWGTDEIDGGPLPVGSKIPNGFGLYDMAGNVEEWVWDRYAIGYEGIAIDNPRGPDAGPLRIVRGGGFVIDRIFTAYTRHPTYPFFVNCDIGFRVACSDPQARADELAAIKTLPLTANDAKPHSEAEPILDARPDTDEAACHRLLPFFDLTLPAMAAVRAAAEKHDWPGTLAAMRDLYVARLKSGDLEPWQAASVDMKSADYWLGICRQQRPIRWAGPETDLGNCWDFEVQPHLAKAWVQTGRREYADAFFWMLNDLALRAKPTWNRLTKAEKGSGGKPRDNFYSYIGFDAGHPLVPFQCLAWMLRHETAEKACEVPARVLANAIYSAIVDHLASGLQDDRGNVPNQVWGNAICIIEFCRLFPELKDAGFLRAEGIARVRNAAGTVMADGTDLEASLNYNAGLFENMEKLNRAFPDAGSRPDWMVELNRRADYRRNMYLAAVTPLGSYPSIGNNSDERDRPRKTMQGWRDKGLTKGLDPVAARILEADPALRAKLPAPAFTSIAFPYAGYYVQRSGWEQDDLYLFMRSSRESVGHNHPDNNNLQLVAYGAYLLIDGGSPTYGPQFMVNHQMVYMPYFGELQVGSVFNVNGLAVDGLEQGRTRETLPGPTSGWDTPRDLRFYVSPQFDLMEGRYAGNYVSEAPVSDKVIQDLVRDYGLDAMAEIVAYNTRVKRTPRRELQAVHQRQVVFLKQEKFWIVVDHVAGGGTYTQNWHFPPPDEGLNDKNYLCPGFAPGQVRTDNAGKRVVTISHYRPNLAILNFSPAEVRYTKHFGDMFPFRGWYAFGLGGERVPAVTVEGTWHGSPPMVTVLLPSRARPDRARTLDAGLDGFAALNTDTVSGFTFTNKGRTVTCQAAREAADIAIGGVTARAKLLLLCQNGKGVTAGMALGCERLGVDGKETPHSAADFEFVIGGGVMKVVAPVTSPAGFRWVDGPNGAVPDYAK